MVTRRPKQAILKISESTLQKQCVGWFRATYPKVLIYATPNEAKRSFALAAHLKAMGMTSGVPDLFIARPMAHYSGLYIELKVHPNKPTENQLSIAQRLIREGYAVYLCYDFESFVHIVSAYFKGLTAIPPDILHKLSYITASSP